MNDDIELDVSVYQCSKCLINEGAVVPCTIVKGSGDIPDQCIFKHGDKVEWVRLG